MLDCLDDVDDGGDRYAPSLKTSSFDKLITQADTISSMTETSIAQDLEFPVPFVRLQWHDLDSDVITGEKG